MSKHQISAEDLELHVTEQLGSLQRLVVVFDEGYISEAKRLAVILRVLLHTGRYPSLLKQVGRDQVDFVDTALEYDPKNLLSTHSLVSLNFQDGEVSYDAPLDGIRALKITPFAKWWNAIVFSDSGGHKMSRSDIVRTAADQDGGAHVDALLREDYKALSRENSLGWVTDGKKSGPSGNAIYAAIRQISHEVLRTLVPGYSRTAQDVLECRRPPEISGGKMRFFPHRRFSYLNNTIGKIRGGIKYSVEIKIESITIGLVRVLLGDNVSGPLSVVGLHRIEIVSGGAQNFGILGDFTDAVLDWVSAHQMPDGANGA